ncbi:hypothetical protein [Moorena sp. SIO3H5]|nr:hypothetical protein [Moorena sp. SIO3H5]
MLTSFITAFFLTISYTELLPVSCSVLCALCSLLPAPCSLLPKS